jgi:uncharacterized damage-inducible protein DinB
MTKASEMISMWKAGRRTMENTLDKINDENIGNRITPAANSVGFLLRHIAEAEHGFSHLAFKGAPVSFQRKTVGPGIVDTGEHTNLDEIKAMYHESEKAVTAAFNNLKDEEWEEMLELRMGTMSRRDYVSYLANHSSYHTGQIALALKYGGKPVNSEQSTVSSQQ